MTRNGSQFFVSILTCFLRAFLIVVAVISVFFLRHRITKSPFLLLVEKRLKHSSRYLFFKDENFFLVLNIEWSYPMIHKFTSFFSSINVKILNDCRIIWKKNFDYACIYNSKCIRYQMFSFEIDIIVCVFFMLHFGAEIKPKIYDKIDEVFVFLRWKLERLIC